MERSLERTGLILRGNPSTSHANRARKAYLDTYARRRYQVPANRLKPSPFVPNVQTLDVVKLKSGPVNPPVTQIPPAQSSSLQSVTVAKPSLAATTSSQRRISRRVVDNFTYSPSFENQSPIYQESAQSEVSSGVRLDTVPANLDKPFIPETQTAVAGQTSWIDDSVFEANLQSLYKDQPMTEFITNNKVSRSAQHIRSIITGFGAATIILAASFLAFRLATKPIVAQPAPSAPVIEVASSGQKDTPIAAPVVKTHNPVRFIIKEIDVNAPVISLGLTKDSLIDAPKGLWDVGWYSKGALPGNAGPAIFVGHYAGGAGSVFDRLYSVQEGTVITVVDGYGKEFKYRITKKAEYGKDRVPMTAIMRGDTKSRLEIITCAGQWLPNGQTYDNRLVVTAEQI